MSDLMSDALAIPDFLREQRNLTAELRAENERLGQRIEGYEASRKYAIQLLATALRVQCDELRAVEYYAQQAANEIERLRTNLEQR